MNDNTIQRSMPFNIWNGQPMWKQPKLAGGNKKGVKSTPFSIKKSHKTYKFSS